MNSTLAPPLIDLASNGSVVFPPDYYTLAAVSRITGSLSIVIWLFAQLPQVFENYINQSVDGVSVAFLACWISGDATNLLGCILTRALSFQICLAAYYCFIDLILSLQFWYYTRVYPRQKVHHNMLQSPNMMRPVLSRGSHGHSSRLMRLNRFESSPHELSVQRSASSGRRGRKPRRSFINKILSASVLSGSFGKANGMPVGAETALASYKDCWKTWAASLGPLVHGATSKIAGLHCSPATIGTAFGWLSSCMYLSSRSPQIWKNYQNKSTKGVSPYLFLLAMLGNMCYTTSIVTDLYLLSKYDQHLGDVEFHSTFVAQLPFVIGSFGTVVFDTILLFQCWYYKPPHDNFHFQAVGKVKRKISDGVLSPQHIASPETRDKRSLHSSTMHFTKPEWYTNVYPDLEDQEDFFNPATTTRHGYYGDHARQQVVRHHLNGRQPDESSLLLHHSLIITPPLHYVSSSSSGQRHEERGTKRGISGTFTAIAKSFSNSSVLRSPSMSSAHSIAASPAVGTSLIPSLVGSYSNVSKKMADESKIPFLPIDFLAHDFGRSNLGQDHA